MPREVEIEIINELAGHPIGTKLLRYSIDADEICARGMARITNEFPPPRSWLLDAYGEVPTGVMSGNQVKQSPAERASEQEFLKNQVAQLDKKHELEASERQRKDAIEKAKREVSRG